MYDRMQTLTEKALETIHKTSMRILREIGVSFHDEDTLKIFQEHNVNVEGHTVFFEEKTIRNAIEAAPSQLTIIARNPEYSVVKGFF